MVRPHDLFGILKNVELCIEFELLEVRVKVELRYRSISRLEYDILKGFSLSRRHVTVPPTSMPPYIRYRISQSSLHGHLDSSGSCWSANNSSRP